MHTGRDVSVTFPGLYLVHQNLPGKVGMRYRRPEHLVFVPLRGEVEVRVGARSLLCGPGRLVYLPPGTVHDFRSSDRQGERLIALVEDRAWQEAGGDPLRASSARAGPVIRNVLLYLLMNPGTRAAPSLLPAFVSIVGEACASFDPSTDLDYLEGVARDPRLRRALAYLRTHLTQPLSMPQLAAAAGVSVRNLNRLFAKELGLAPKAILVRNRIDLARELLGSGDRSILEVALDVGYNSMSQFFVAFRRGTGQLPSEFVAAGAAPASGTRPAAKRLGG